MKLQKNIKLDIPESFLKKLKEFFVSLFFLLFTAGTSFAQYDYLLEFEHLYPDCVDDGAGATIYGGSYPNKWPKGLELPEFPGGGEVQFTRFIHSNTDYPDVVDEAGERLKGVVYVEIVIDRCGRATKQKVVQSIHDDYDAEALRIMTNLPVFKPGAVNGMRVQVALVVPVFFTRNTLPKKKHVEDQEYNYDDYDW